MSKYVRVHLILTNELSSVLRGPMNKTTVIALLIAVVGVSPGGITAANAQSVANGDFEAPRVNGYVYNVAGGSFTFVEHSGIAAAGSGFTYGNTSNSTQVAFLQFGTDSLLGGTASSFYEDVYIAKPGEYVVTFSAAQRGLGSAHHITPHPSDLQDFSVLINGYEVGTYQPPGTDYTSFTTSRFTVNRPESITLEFRGIDSLGDDETAFIDNVSIAADNQYVKRKPLNP